MALKREADSPLAWITSVGCSSGVEAIPTPEVVLLSAWNPTLMEALTAESHQHWPGIPIHSCAFGETLAAGPGLAWVAGLDLINQGYDSVLIRVASIDGYVAHLGLRRHL